MKKENWVKYKTYAQDRIKELRVVLENLIKDKKDLKLVDAEKKKFRKEKSSIRNMISA